MEPEREKFRAYIEQSGLMSALTNVLITLYEEPNRPKDALTYMIENLGSKSVDLKKMEVLEQKCKELEKECKDLQLEKEMLKEQVAKLKLGSEEVTVEPAKPEET